MPATPSKGRNVKRGAATAPDGAADRHERAKDYLSPGDMAKLLDAAKARRHGGRDHLLLLMTYRHGLRVSETIGMRRDELISTAPGYGCAGSRAGCPSSSRLPATSCAPSSVISPPAPTRCPGCSSPNAASRSPVRRSTT
jgi:hypothetical protein